MVNRRRLGAAGLAIVIGSGLLAHVPGAHALPVTVPAAIISSGCSRPLPYQEGIGDGQFRGHYQGYKPRGASGSVTYCTFKYRLNDRNRAGDYYVGEIQEDWSKKRDADSFFGGRGGQWLAGVTSSRDARSNVFNGTPSFDKVAVGCPTLKVGYTFLGIGLSLDQQLCGSQTVTRSDLTRAGAWWRNGSASDMRHVDLTFSEKVAEKKVPRLVFYTTRPAYTYSWTAVQEQDHGYYYRGWKPTRTRLYLSWNSTR